MSTHPAEVNEALGLAHARCKRLIDDAEKRGDSVGADAWLVALRSIESAEAVMRDARTKQTWREQQATKPWTPDFCAKCGRSEIPHPYRHVFVAWRPGMPAASTSPAKGPQGEW